ncbi:MAG: SDR family NAD(P)-dependent oxidoreductase [Dehalococcoidia bacterium]|nr:SDR family NAD(P)-dependent oxidoreductase [Dehalococcoidia bacterium]
MGALDGKAVVITGAGRGIGRATALQAAAEGASVVVADNGCEPDGTGANPACAQAVVDEITPKGGKATAVTEDVATMAGAEAAVRAALDGYGRVDALITCAGIRRDTPFWEMTEGDWDSVINGNAKATFNVVKVASIAMRQQRYGRIVMMTSDAGLGAVGSSNFAAASEGVIGLSRTVARDLGRYGVTCNAVSPLARTRLFGGFSEELRPPAGVLSADEMARIARPFPTMHWEGDAHPDDPASVAPLACYLASEASEDVNGQLFGVRGGEVYLYSYPAIDRQILSFGRRFTMDEMDEQMPRTLANGVASPLRV